MADICKCEGTGCILRRKCYRFTAPDTPHRQSWFTEMPNHNKYQCDYFWSNKGRNVQRKKTVNAEDFLTNKVRVVFKNESQ